jgi:hypothetical protein
MDKLQPLIRHRYWICFCFAVIFATVGWWMASGSLAVAIETERKKVDDAFSKVKNGVNDPNEHWVAAAKKRNEADQSAKQAASRLLWQRQKSARKWPTVLEAELSNIPYFDQIKSNTARARWARNYPTQIQQLLDIVKPFKRATGEGLVIVGLNNISYKPFRSWRTGPPSSAEIWNNQEDIWLLQSLLSSIAKVNDGATRLSESQVRQINRLHLRGGDPEAPPASAMGGGMEMGGMSMGGMSMGGMSMGGMSMPGGEGAAMGMGMAMGGGVGGLNAAGVPNPAKAFEGSPGNDILAEEFGAVAGSGGLGGSPMGNMDSMALAERMSGGGGDAMGVGGASAPVEEVRYVHQKEGLYKTRAFLLDVVVRDDQVPNLLASLTNSDFPVEIVRVDIASGVKSGSGVSGGNMMTAGEGESGDAVAMGMPSGMGEMMAPGGMGSMSGLGSDPSFGMTPGTGMDMPGGDGMGLGMGEYGMSGSGGLATGSSAATRGAEIYQAAMSDPLLVTVKIGGLMTLYQSLEEAQQQEATEDAAVTEQSAAPATSVEAEEAEMAGDTVVEEGTEAVASDSAATGEIPAGSDPASPAAVDAAGNSSAVPAVDPDTGAPAAVPSAEGVPAGEVQPPAVPEPGATENGGSDASGNSVPISETPSSDPGETPSPN